MTVSVNVNLSTGLLTLWRNLHSRGSVSLPSCCSTMCVRLSRESSSLQLHTAWLWIREPRGREARKRRGSQYFSLKTGSQDTRSSAWIRSLASFSRLSRCWRKGCGHTHTLRTLWKAQNPPSKGFWVWVQVPKSEVCLQAYLSKMPNRYLLLQGV